MPGVDAEFATSVLDASIAVRWVATEAGSRRASELLNLGIVWVVPRLLLTEVGSALRRKVQLGELSSEAAMEGLQTLIESAEDGGTLRLADDEKIAPLALTIALTHGHKFPDCVYVALAEREGAGLVTGDVALARLAETRGIATMSVPSS